MQILLILIVLLKVTVVKLDLGSCVVDRLAIVPEGDVVISTYPWLGVLYYRDWDGDEKTRAVTTVALIHEEFVIGSATDIAVMPKKDFRRNARVLLGEGWTRPGLRVLRYVLHPEYAHTVHTIALVQLKHPVRSPSVRPLCPPPEVLFDPQLYIVKIKEDLRSLNKEVFKAVHIPGKMCKDYYEAANLNSQAMRPPNIACAVAVHSNEACVWDTGAALVSRDLWGRWQLLGIGVRGPGCGAPSRFLDLMTYYPWIANILPKLQRMAIARRHYKKYILRGTGA